ncbi:hypothetical protein JCM25156A_31110 [Komagataeibacter kakiaceti JCM 25156]|uniref:hypothetical protein n=1 Tax=Komagataeibacter kakiaceti TaxID=943261 RepID=UPI00046FA4DA|nr:hypothetical protein [Komagataeibacter kakiaceti]
METHSAIVPESGQVTTAHEALIRVIQVMDRVHEELLDTQQVIDKCVQNHMLDEGEMHNLQKLDSATQTVEALATALKNLTAHSDVGKSDRVNVAALSDGIKLSEVVRILAGEKKTDTTHQCGEIDLF